MLTILEKDREFVRNLPVYTVVGASAGTGKTRALKQRFIQLLLSKSIPNNKPENILAITFTNNAAREMKQRVLGALKSASLGDRDTLKELQAILSQGQSELQLHAGTMVDAILDDYSAFQILTIDSFLARVFKASALELGLSPDLEIVLDSDALLDEAFSLFARELSEGTDSAQLLKELLHLLSESQRADDRFVWNPHPYLGEKVKDLYKKIVLTSSVLRREEYTDEIHECSKQFMRQVMKLDTLTTREGLLKIDRFEKFVALADTGDIDSLLRLQIPYPPVKKTGSKPAVYKEAVLATQSLTEELNALKQRLILLKARQHYQPYADALTLLAQSTETVKRERGQVDIGDVVKRLAEYLRPGVVFEIYYSLGESLCHYLIDEFQDTNPIQWDTLAPLIENALSTKGSLFVVGDTKQSIYGFRGADWKIMKRLQQEDVFPSARKDLKTLTINFRSFGRILGFNTTVFQSIMPHKVIEAAATASGLATDQQLVNKDFADKGYVELMTIPAEDTFDSGDPSPQKQKLLDIVKDCVARGYRHSDITILSPRNDDIIEVSGWLNGKNIPFISHSSLDVRRRRATGELLALLRFLDSPIDDLSFTTFLLGGIFDKLLQRTGSHIGPRQLQDFLFKHKGTHRGETPLYVSFRQTHPDLWKVVFEELYTVVGYLPVYDLISEIYRRFRLFAALPDEEATLVKILEVVKDFEGRGENSLKAFLQYAQESSEDADWDISIPSDVDAVRVMTIHKAKGLESKVTIVLLYDVSPRRDGLYLEDDREQVRLVHVTKDNAAAAPELQKLYQEKELALVVDDLNKLYVALTRAEEEMYILSVKSRRTKVPSEFFPETGYEPQPKPIVERREPKSRIVVTLSHDVPHVTTHPAEYDSIPLHETKRGEFIHAVLEQIEYADDHLDKRLREAINRASALRPFKIETQAVYDLLFTAINLPDLLGYFTKRPGRKILNEQEFVTPAGSLTRMDRVVIDPDSVTVLDYKTGDEKADYAKQVSNYMETLRDLFKNRSVHGLLVYLDRKTVRAIP